MSILTDIGIYGAISAIAVQYATIRVNKKIESFKAELNLYNTRESAVFQKRVEVIGETYRLLVHLDSAMRILVRKVHIAGADPEKEKQDRSIRAIEALRELNNYFLVHKIYLSLKMASQLDKMLNVYQDVEYNYHSTMNLIEMGAAINYDEIEDELNECHKKVNNLYSSIQDNLESSIRDLLQIESK